MKTPVSDNRSPAKPAYAARRLAPLLACCGALILLVSGCESGGDSHLVSAPPPTEPSRSVTTTTVVAAPAAAVYPAYAVNQAPVQAVNTIVVTQAPPALQTDVAIAQPNPQDVWLAGYWTWRDGRYEWMAGHWELPPSPSSVWVAPRWEQQGNAYRFYEGYWN